DFMKAGEGQRKRKMSAQLSKIISEVTAPGSAHSHFNSIRALSENLTKQPLLRNFLHPLNREELDVGHRHPLGLQQQIPQVLIAPAAVNQHTNVPVHRFHHSEAYLRAAVVHYTFEVFEQ